LFEFSSIEQYHAQLKEGKFSCLQAVEYYLQQISAAKHLNAFIEIYAEEVLQKARSSMNTAKQVSQQANCTEWFLH
jgi:aspartyl-tRNA(Asn)/glutamyl-tRNA(Gln) amidotransferase subunit A